ncbi:MAG: hypothetical protein GY833_18275 [Aestuariibacter sp.]|nr:hypothetical protein [Aestuariibacter sp.]
MVEELPTNQSIADALEAVGDDALRAVIVIGLNKDGFGVHTHSNGEDVKYDNIAASFVQRFYDLLQSLDQPTAIQ